MKTISVKVEDELWRKTRQCALDGGVSLTEVVARLLRCYVDGKIVLKGALTEGEPGAAGSAASPSRPRPVRDAPSVSREERETPSASPSVSVPDIPGVKRASEITPPVDPVTGEVGRNRSSKCPMFVPAGSKCKSCGKVHTA